MVKYTCCRSDSNKKEGEAIIDLDRKIHVRPILLKSGWVEQAVHKEERREGKGRRGEGMGGRVGQGRAGLGRDRG